MAAEAPADPILGLDAVALRERLAAGSLRAAELVEACLAQIARREPAVGAWAWIDPDHARRQARALDEHRAAGRPIGPLHGLPVGLKDIVDAAGMPTGNGTAVDAGRVPQSDAFVVRRLRQAGAVVMGKTVTTELAFRHPGTTRNPHDPARTPGGSSSGSAAAVAAAMVPLAIGTQTVGSVIRPASFCGVVGFKPSFGAIPRTGILAQAPSLDTAGVFAGSVAGAALLAETLFGCDPGDPATRPAPAPGLAAVAGSEPPVRPSLAFVRQPAWDTADPDIHAGFAELLAALGDACDEAELPPAFAEAGPLCELVQLAEMAKSYHRYRQRAGDRLSPELVDAIDRGRRILAHDYLAARDWPGVLTASLEAVFERYDAILTPAASGPAPPGLDSTGSPAFNALWSFCGLPAVTVPLLQSYGGLPIGVQLVGRHGDDGRLLRTARWLAAAVSAQAGSGSTEDGQWTR
ncbi:glutamyl-tRNA amidotransferase subunit A [Thalassobaculum fulvum]|uniref:Glutamyl-tRNA amidotransferase subunit A n=1 Tax=Thalassobaculum fulvum TaxID=1633335 RepID=A0A918XS30_9PROT|nr:amidase [Thalassobaculum fulvum]GHD51374.1 glutamyl-tRNA amidotransferase subunit A [Thalassobaculum fulvum]